MRTQADGDHKCVGRTLDLLKAALRPFIERELRAVHKENWIKGRDAGGAGVADHQGNRGVRRAGPSHHPLGQLERTLSCSILKDKDRIGS